MLLMILMEKKFSRAFNEKELQEANQNEFRTERVIKRKGGKLHAKLKGYNNLLNSWIDKKDII